jgi:hypothetical protein
VGVNEALEASPADGPRVAPAAATGASFIDRLLDAIRALPFGGWWVYPLALVLIEAWVAVVPWLNGTAPVGRIDVATLAFFPYPVFALAMIHYLDDVADRALTTFTPVIDDPASLATWRSRFTRFPARQAAVAALAGLAFGFIAMANVPPTLYRQFSPDLLTTALWVGWLTLPGFALAALLLLQTWRQLRAVSAIHAAATRIDPFELEPVFAFSRLTARTGLGYLLIVYYSVLTTGGAYGADPQILLLDVLFGSAALACFILPLLGMHRKLAAAKADLRAQVRSRVRPVSSELYRRIDRDELVGMAELDDTISSLARLADIVDRLPTWPWAPQLLRGFLSAALLPIVIWFVTRVLGNVLPV